MKANREKDQFFLDLIRKGKMYAKDGVIYNAQGKRLGSTRADGETMVAAIDHSTGKTKMINTRRLVWMAHHNRPVPEDYCVAYKDLKNRSTNIENLVLATEKLTRKRAVELAKTSLDGRPKKFTNSQILAIKLLGAFFDDKAISEMLGIPYTTVRHALDNKTYKDSLAIYDINTAIRYLLGEKERLNQMQKEAKEAKEKALELVPQLLEETESRDQS